MWIFSCLCGKVDPQGEGFAVFVWMSGGEEGMNACEKREVKDKKRDEPSARYTEASDEWDHFQAQLGQEWKPKLHYGNRTK